ncbi:hypothetical protein QBC33DRAFT_340123 [Phialemonium atrogriseum]|uniref:Uncharacterized protein n=1 Tax=Phialemonium atrogriseum TaxID=1093897 RepID=A0AAJ0C5G4_9PEZI|nr:uncharacterized protein QBC33DRAFT_340123 [Phialemonium atrogriseum]KAK1769069.1 hypothetical protein QBC33DRAFT_340123 [Phialemonium atrogriseum]
MIPLASSPGARWPSRSRQCWHLAYLICRLPTSRNRDRELAACYGLSFPFHFSLSFSVVLFPRSGEWEKVLLHRIEWCSSYQGFRRSSGFYKSVCNYLSKARVTPGKKGVGRRGGRRVLMAGEGGVVILFFFLLSFLRLSAASIGKVCVEKALIGLGSGVEHGGYLPILPYLGAQNSMELDAL